MRLKRSSFIFVLMLVVSLAIIAAGCGSTNQGSGSGNAQQPASQPEAEPEKQEEKPKEQPKDKQVTLKAGNILAPTDPLNEGLKKMAELVEQKSGGSLKLDLFPASQLGGAPEQIEGVRLGSQDMFVGAVAWYQDMEGLYDLRIFSLPPAFRSYEHIKKFLDSEDGQKIFAEMESRYNLVTINYDWYRPPRQILANRPVRNLNELKGLKIRVPGNELWVGAFKAIGASPTPIAWGEVYTSLASKVVDAAEAPVSLIYSSKFQEQVKNLTMSNHTFMTVSLVINKDKYGSLTENQKKALTEAAKEAGVYQTELYSQSEIDNLEKMKQAGVNVYELDNRDEFFAPVLDFAKKQEEAGAWTKGLYQKVQEIK